MISSEPGYVKSKLAMGGRSSIAIIRVEVGILGFGADMVLKNWNKKY